MIMVNVYYRKLKKTTINTQTFTWLIFLTMPNLGELLFTLPDPIKHDVRRLEKCFLKLQKTELSCAFNRTCLTENILPKYTNIKLHDMAANREDFTKEFRRQLVERQLEAGKQELVKLREENEQRRTAIANKITDDTLRNNILQTINNNAEKVRQQTHKTMLKKLQKFVG